MSLLIATNSASRSSAVVSTSAYRNPWNVNVGSSTVTSSSARMYVSVALARPQRPRVEGPVRLEHLGVPDRDDASPRDPRTVSRT